MQECPDCIGSGIGIAIDVSVPNACNPVAHGTEMRISFCVYAELSVRYDSMEGLEVFLKQIGIEMAAMPKAALYLAGKVSAQYRRSDGARTGVLPDFFIGSHAVVSQLPLLTRYFGRYRTHFPSIALITPQP